jgi:hypothetical protein
VLPLSDDDRRHAAVDVHECRGELRMPRGACTVGDTMRWPCIHVVRLVGEMSTRVDVPVAGQHQQVVRVDRLPQVVADHARHLAPEWHAETGARLIVAEVALHIDHDEAAFGPVHNTTVIQAEVFTVEIMPSSSDRMRLVSANQRHTWTHDGGLHEIPLDEVPGRLWLCGKHVVGPDPEGVLSRTGADTVVCLTERHELADRYPDYVRWLDHEHERAVWFPVHDLHAPAFAQGKAFVDDLARRLRAGHGLVVHCAAGIGRAGTTAVAVLVTLGETPERALAHVRAHRPMAGPEVGVQQDFITRLARERIAT